MRRRRGGWRRGWQGRPKYRAARPSRAIPAAPASCSSTPGRTGSPKRAASVENSCLRTAAARSSTPPIPWPARPSSSSPTCRARRRARASRPRLRYPRTISAPRSATASRHAQQAPSIRQKRSVRVRETARLGAIVLVGAHAACSFRRGGRSGDPRRDTRARAVSAQLEQGSRDAAPAPVLAASWPRRAMAGCVRRGADRHRSTTGCCPSCTAKRLSPASTPAPSMPG